MNLNPRRPVKMSSLKNEEEIIYRKSIGKTIGWHLMKKKEGEIKTRELEGSDIQLVMVSVQTESRYYHSHCFTLDSFAKLHNLNLEDVKMTIGEENYIQAEIQSIGKEKYTGFIAEIPFLARLIVKYKTKNSEFLEMQMIDLLESQLSKRSYGTLLQSIIEPSKNIEIKIINHLDIENYRVRQVYNSVVEKINFISENSKIKSINFESMIDAFRSLLYVNEISVYSFDSEVVFKHLFLKENEAETLYVLFVFDIIIEFIMDMTEYYKYKETGDPLFKINVDSKILKPPYNPVNLNNSIKVFISMMVKDYKERLIDSINYSDMRIGIWYSLRNVLREEILFSEIECKRHKIFEDMANAYKL